MRCRTKHGEPSALRTLLREQRAPTVRSGCGWCAWPARGAALGSGPRQERGEPAAHWVSRDELDILDRCWHLRRQRDVETDPITRCRRIGYGDMLVVVPVLPILDRRHGERCRGLMAARPMGVHHRVRDRDARTGKTQQAGGERSEESEGSGRGHEYKLPRARTNGTEMSPRPRRILARCRPFLPRAEVERDPEA